MSVVYFRPSCFSIFYYAHIENDLFLRWKMTLGSLNYFPLCCREHGWRGGRASHGEMISSFWLPCV